jgi:PKD domain
MPKARLISCLLAALLLVSGCGGGNDHKKKATANALEDPDPSRDDFHIKADANQFAGPTPLTAHFRVAAFKASGPVRYKWTFDDGTTTTVQNPTHTFKQAGSYSVLCDAVDQKKHNDRWNLVLGVWPKKVWEGKKPIEEQSKQEIRSVQKAQQQRTYRRIRKLQRAGLPTGSPTFPAKPEHKAKQ